MTMYVPPELTTILPVHISQVSGAAWTTCMPFTRSSSITSVNDRVRFFIDDRFGLIKYSPLESPHEIASLAAVQ
jgi:hypothetical protein